MPKSIYKTFVRNNIASTYSFIKYINVIIIKTLELNGKIYELERNRICYSNSPIGRNMVVEKLP